MYNRLRKLQITNMSDTLGKCHGIQHKPDVTKTENETETVSQLKRNIRKPSSYLYHTSTFLINLSTLEDHSIRIVYRNINK